MILRLIARAAYWVWRKADPSGRLALPAARAVTLPMSTIHYSPPPSPLPSPAEALAALEAKEAALDADLARMRAERGERQRMMLAARRARRARIRERFDQQRHAWRKLMIETLHLPDEES